MLCQVDSVVIHSISGGGLKKNGTDSSRETFPGFLRRSRLHFLSEKVQTYWNGLITTNSSDYGLVVIHSSRGPGEERGTNHYVNAFTTISSRLKLVVDAWRESEEAVKKKPLLSVVTTMCSDLFFRPIFNRLLSVVTTNS